MTDPKPSRSRPLRLVMALVGVGLVLLASLTWLNRRTLAREALTGWLSSKGVASDATVEAIGPTTFTARLRIGDPRQPDFLAERVEVRYRPRLSGIEITSVTLKKPVLRASLRGGKLGVGALDPLVREFLSRPPPPGSKMPRIQIDGGMLVLSTDPGAVRVTGDLVFEDSQLKSLAGTSAPTRLRGKGYDVSLGQGVLRAATRAGRLDIALDAPVGQFTVGPLSSRTGRINLSAQAPYPDVKARRGDGAVVAKVQFASRRLDLAGQSLEDADLAAAFTGQARGWVSDLAVEGQAVANLAAKAGRFGGADVRVIRAAATAGDVRWTRKGGDEVSGTLRMNGGLEGLATGDLRISALTLTATGPVSMGPKGVVADLTGSAVGRGGWTGLGAPVAADSKDLAAVKRAARSFRFAAPAVAWTLGDDLTIRLPQPVSLVPDKGGKVQVAARAGAPVFSRDGGAFRLNVAGGGLPRVEADVARLALDTGGLTAMGRVRARTSIGLVEGGDIDASGRLKLANGGLAFTADRCVALKIARLEFGANDVEALSGRLCPAGGPLFSFRNGDWTLTARTEALTAVVPFLQARISSGAAQMTANSTRGRLRAQGRVTAARLEDTAAAGRFNPLALSGDVSFADYLWKAELTAQLPGGAQVGRASLAHDMGLGVGLVVLDTDTLTFADGGLQPAQLSPLASAIGSPAVGSVQFKGRFDWARQGASSSGTLTIPGLDFQSAAGPVEGLKGEIVFTSLAPLVAAPGQELEIAKVTSALSFTDLRARFGLADNLLKIAGGEATVGGGRARVESLEYPLVPGAPTRGVLILEGVQLHDLVEASPFGDKVEFDAKVSGRMAFEVVDGRVRITAGELKADQPGRISIDRVALTGVQTATPDAPAQAVNANDTFTDFAYQAMENLAFDKLEATVASRPDGRLGVLFHIVGRHDPPQKQRIRLSIMDLIQKRFIGKKLPLPSGTGVNLTLDTTLNLDDLLSDYAEYRRLHGSGPVQP